MNFLLKIIVEYSSLRDFAPYKLGEMIHPNFVESHSSFDILLSLPPPQMCTQPQVTLSPIHNPQYETIFSKHGYGTHCTQKFM